MYIWNYGAVVENGILRSPHTMEIGFAFDNLDKGPLLYGNAPAAKKLAVAASNAWVAFARAGDPNVKGLPYWPAYDAAARATMIFDAKSAVVNDPYADFRKILLS